MSKTQFDINLQIVNVLVNFLNGMLDDIKKGEVRFNRYIFIKVYLLMKIRQQDMYQQPYREGSADEFYFASL